MKPRGRPLNTPLLCSPHRRKRVAKCPMLNVKVKTRGVPTFRYGRDPRLFIIAEAPGRDEDLQGEPMVGSAGQMTWMMLARAGLTRCYIGNSIRCHPPKNRDPDEQELAICTRHLWRELKRVKPEVVLLMGGIAGRLLHKRTTKISRLRGWHSLPIGDGESIRCYVTNHPSAIHYNADIQPIIEQDLALVRRYLDGYKPITKIRFKKKYLDTIEKLRRAVDITLKQKRTIGMDFEARSAAKIGNTLTNITWGWGYNKQWMYELPLEHPLTPWSAEEFEEVKDEMRRMLTAPARIIQFLAHNSKFELMQLMDFLGEGLDAPNFRILNAPIVCSMQRAHACDENRLATGDKGIYSLEALGASWCGVSSAVWDPDVSDALYNTGPDGLNFAHKIHPRKLCDHAGKDVSVSLKIHQETNRRCKAEGYDLGRLDPLLSSIPYLLAVIERNGVPLNLSRLSHLKSDKGPIRKRKDQIERTMDKSPACKKAIKQIRGGVEMDAMFSKTGSSHFEINKREYLLPLFFDVLGLEVIGRSDKTKEPSIDKEFFDFYKDQKHAKLVHEWRQLDKLETSYIDNWFEFVTNSPDNRVRGDFRGTGTNTGRLAAANPNWQQIPSGRNKAAKKVKGIIMPHSTEDQLNIIVAGDFSQAEIRWLAQISGEKVLADMFWKRHEMLRKYARKPSEAIMNKIKSQCDLHRSTAAEVFGIPVLSVDPNQRRHAKTVSFGIVYGQTEYGLSANLGISEAEARELHGKWLGRFVNVNRWFHYIENYATKNGFVESPIGRRRHLPTLLIQSDRSKAAGHARRVARNAPIQSVASDMNLWTAIKIQRYIDAYNKPWKILALIHDSILVELPIEDALEYIKVAGKIAHDSDLLEEFGVKIDVPQEFEFEVGYSYGECIGLTPSLRETEGVLDRLYDRWYQGGPRAII